MDEYIRREDAIDAIRERCAPCGEGIEALKAVPSADVAPVVHGRWIKRKTWNFYVCSECSFETSPYTSCMNYCPNCGCRMDLSEGVAHDT